MQINVDDIIGDIAIFKNYLRHNEKLSSSDCLGQFYSMVDFFSYVYGIKLSKKVFTSDRITKKNRSKIS